MIVRKTTRNRYAVLNILLMLCTIPVVLLMAIQTVSADDAISVLWKRASHPPVSLAMSAGARYFGTVDKDGNVRLYNNRGNILWAQTVKGATNMLIARNGQSVLVYSRLNTLYQYVNFFTSNGRRLWKHRVDGSVWAGAVSPDGQFAAVTTGKGYAYIYTPDPVSPKYRRWKLEGIGHCIDFTPDGEKVIVGTWQNSMLASYDINGKFLWRSRHDTDRQYDVQVSSDGKTVLGMLPGSQHDDNIEIGLWDSGGKRLWSQHIDGFDAKALVSPKSRYVAISYAKYLSPDNSDIVERKVSVFTSRGRLAWDKGGLFFGPSLVALSPKGSSVIVTDSVKSLFRIDGRGKIVSKLALGGTVREIQASDDGSKVLLYCGDGLLYLLDIE